MKYTPLHVHTHYSLLDGLAKIDDLIAKAKEDGMSALAITDHGTMYGVIEFYQKCKAAGIKPIIGVEAYLVDDLKEKNVASEERFHLILLAKDFEGYKNLIKLTTIAHLEGFYYKPRIDWQVLKEHSQGLICSSACLQGELAKAIINGKPDSELEKIVKKYQDVFGKDDYYLEVQHHPNLPKQKIVNAKIFDLGKKYNVPIIATNDSHYVNTEDAEAHDILICLQTKHTISEENRMSYLGEDFSLYTCDQMSDFFRGNLEILENTNKIAEKCNLEIPLGEIQLPHYELPEGKDAFTYLTEFCFDNVIDRYSFDPKSDQLTEKQKSIIERLEYELSIIEKTGYASYFLIVQDFINWAKKQGIVVGPGRGSAAGSIVAYLTHITDLDPIEYDLLFERFLNPARISMPDIDTDFADIRRDEVIRYTEEKYGKDHVAQIITFGTMAARAAVKDVGRVLEMPYSFCDQISKLIPMNMKLDEAISQIVELKEMYQKNDDAKRLIDFAKKIEGVARHASTHACGVVITQKPLSQYCPCQYSRDSEDVVVSQYSLHPVEDLGLLKMDFLGLKNLTIMEQACEIISKMHNIKIDLANIDLNDQKTLQLFQEAQTTGVFQFESSGMKRYLKQLKPTNIEDLIAMVSLYRPGPMDLIPDFILRKHGQQTVEYLHPKLEKSLAKTFGIAIYQEQIMQIARDLAGFSLGEADVLRKAVGKKKVDLLAEQKEKFIKGCEENQIDKKTAEDVFAFIEPFAGYGFNRSHAACYAFIAYQTAYLKANYPAEFMAALLTADQHNMDRIAIEIDECKQMGITILPPNINESYSTFTVVAESLKKGKPTIRFGLTAIRNVGEAVAKQIIHERKENGEYKSLEDFLERLSSKELNKKSLEGLIKSGALDLFNDRSILLENIEKLLLFIKEIELEKSTKQTNLFSLNGNSNEARAKLILNKIEEHSRTKILAWEKEFLGLYVSDHPFKYFAKTLECVATRLSGLREIMGESRLVRVAGIIGSVKKIMTKKGDPMLFVMIEDEITNVELLVFPKLYKNSEIEWEEGKIVIADGALSDKDEEPKVLCNNIWEVNKQNYQEVIQTLRETSITDTNKKGNWQKKETQPQVQKFEKIVLNYPAGADKELAQKVKMLFMGIPGNFQVFLQINDKLIKTNFRINLDDNIKQQINALLGANAIKNS